MDQVAAAREAVGRDVDEEQAVAFAGTLKRQGGAVHDQDLPTIVEHYEVNTKALHLTLFIAQELGGMP